MAQPASPFTPRQLVRSVPFSTPLIYIGTLAAAQGFGGVFDAALTMSDRNLVATSSAAPTRSLATGYFFDCSVVSDQASTLDVLVLAGPTAAGNRSVMPGGTPIVVAANTLTFVAGLRVIGIAISVQFVNTSGVVANVEVFSAVRSQ